MAESFVMLAQPWVTRINPLGWMMSEKLDGYRARWTQVGSEWMMVSRYGNRLKLPQWFIDGLPKVELDGEMYMGRGTFQELSSVIRHPEAIAFRRIRYQAFDLVDKSGFDAWTRYDMLRDLMIKAPATASWSLVFQEPCKGVDHMIETFDAVIKHGGEGIMLKDPLRPYEFKRSTGLRKLKYTEQTEATVLDYEPGKGKYTGLIGAAVVKTSDGKEFRVGTGWSDEDRRTPPPIGSIIRISTLGRTLSGKARVASYKGTIL